MVFLLIAYSNVLLKGCVGKEKDIEETCKINIVVTDLFSSE